MKRNIAAKDAGIVLITTLILIGLLALLTLSQLQILLLNYKVLNLASEQQKDFLILEKAAKQLLKQIDRKAHGACSVSKNESVNLDFLFEKQSCPLVYEKQQFHYLIEDLGVFPCLQIKQDKQIYSTRHFRLSVQSDKNKDPFTTTFCKNCSI